MLKKEVLMWNLLITIIIAIIIWLFSANMSHMGDNGSLKMPNNIKPQTTKSAVKTLTQDTVNEVDKARELQQQETTQNSEQ
jgi:uncharacterized FAD-dependent dehydrogenase